MSRPLALAALLTLALAAAGCGEKPEPGAGAERARARTLRLVLDYFPNADHAGIYAAQAAGEYDARRARRRHQGAAGPDRAAEAAAGGPRRPRASPTSPSCCWRATRAPTTWSRSARSCRSR